MFRKKSEAARETLGTETLRVKSKHRTGVAFGPGRSRKESNFYKIRDECLVSGRLWEDLEFDAVDSSLFYNQPPSKELVWRRPRELVQEPWFVVEGVSRFDVRQGELGNCWLLAAIVNLSMQPTLFERVVPRGQSFSHEYAGVFRFRFWRFGTWTEVLVDDRLPTWEGRLVYVRSTRPDEFWSALFEKAYAKLFGSYEALKGGNASEAMTEFTGGIVEVYNMEDPPSQLYQILLKASERNSLMSCSINADSTALQKRTPGGLIMGHAYSITRVQKVNVVMPDRKGQVEMLRLRNPWGSEDSWAGPWSDGSPEWRVVPEAERRQINLTFGADGDFWMAYRDFAANFDMLEICNLTPDWLEDDGGACFGSGQKRWEVHMYNGEWVRGVTAGGCRNNLDTFGHNPQYRITLAEVDEGSDEGTCTVVISLMQKNRRALRRMGADLLAIGFVIYRLDNTKIPPIPLDKTFFKYNESVARSPSFVNMRQVCCRFKLEPGDYCVVPSTFQPDQEAEFLLRVFSEKPHAMVEHDNDVEYTELDNKTDVPQHNNPEDRKLTDKVLEYFLKLGGDEKEVVWLELKEVLDYGMQKEALSKGGFSKDICRSMIAMYDSGYSGKMGLEEFEWLWLEVCRLKGIYQRYREGSGSRLRTSELREALAAAGYRLNGRVLNMLAHRYAGRDGKVSLDDFIMCAVKLNTMILHFRRRDVRNTLRADFTLQQWIMLTVGC